MPEKLIDVLERKDLPDRTKLLALLAPGCMFGFPPDNLQAIIERVDCEYCRLIIEITMQGSALYEAVNKQVDEFLGPVRERNAKRRADHERRRKWPVIGWMFREPRLEHEPDFRCELWYIEAMGPVEALGAKLDQLEASDPKHWGDEAVRAVSGEVVKLAAGAHRQTVI